MYVCVCLYTFLQNRLQLRNFVILHLEILSALARHIAVYRKLAIKSKRKKKNELIF